MSFEIVLNKLKINFFAFNLSVKQPVNFLRPVAYPFVLEHEVGPLSQKFFYSCPSCQKLFFEVWMPPVIFSKQKFVLEQTLRYKLSMLRCINCDGRSLSKKLANWMARPQRVTKRSVPIRNSSMNIIFEKSFDHIGCTLPLVLILVKVDKVLPFFFLRKTF